MTEIIEQFIYDQLEYKLNFTEHDVRLKSGRIIAELLYNYKIITDVDLSLIESTEDGEIIVRNFENIRKWLYFINIELDDEIYQDLTSGALKATLYLFYELYLTLNDKFYLRKKSKFVKVERKHEKLTDKLSENNILKRLLITNEDKIDWRKLSYEKLLECYKAKKNEYEKICQRAGDVSIEVKSEYEFDDTKITNPLNDTVTDASCNEMLQELITIENLDKLEYDIDLDQPKKLLQKLHDKLREKEKLNVVRYKLHRMLLEKLWEIIIKKQNTIFEKKIRENVLKQSDYEQKVATSLLIEKEENARMTSKIQAEKKILRIKEDEMFTEKLLNTPKDDLTVEYYMDLYKKLRLHRELYEAKLLRKKERYQLFCEDVFSNLVNVAINFAEHRLQYHNDPDWKQKFVWKDLFIKGRPLIDKLEDDSLSYCSCDEDDEDLEKIAEVEIDILIQNLLQKYLNYKEPFTLVYDQYDERLIEPSRLGCNVLGHIVHLLLLSKYPKPSVLQPVDLPTVNVAACLTSLTDLMILPHLQKLLTEKGIVIINIDDCIKFCVDQYKKETTMEYVDPPPVEETDGNKTKGKKKDKKKEKKKDKEKKSKKDKDKKSKKPKSDKSSKSKAEPQFIEIALQTPYIYPCEEIVLSQKASLGQTAEEYIKSEINLPDDLIVKIFIEYLKSLKDIKGWVLVNFPQTVNQVALLEEHLTGKPLLFEKEEVCSSSTSLNTVTSKYFIIREVDENEKYRQSYLLIDPKPEPPDNYYNTYLTAFITLKLKTKEEETYKYCYVYNEDDEKDINQLSPLEQFYTDQGCNYVYFYEKLDFPAVKQIGKIIIGEYTLPPKASISLFGTNLAAVELDMTQPKKQKDSKKSGKSKKSKTSKKDKKDKKEKKGKKDKKGGKSKAKQTKEIKVETSDKQSQAPDIEEESEIYSCILEGESLEELHVPEPGEPDWTYISMPMSLSIKNNLATTWEYIEETYLSNLRMYLLFHHFTMNLHIPYTKYVKRLIEESSVFFDHNQEYVDEFQTIYNSLIEIGPLENNAIQEIQCRIEEMREKFLRLVDERTFYMESIRKIIIDKNWVAYQIIELVNLCILLFQIEIYRCADTMGFLSEYYVCMIKRKFTEETSQFKNIIIEHICGVDDTFEVKCIKEFIKVSLKNTCVNFQTDPVLHVITNKSEECLSAITSARNYSLEILDDAELLLNTSLLDYYSKTNKYVEPSKEAKKESVNILKEWRCAIEGEYARTKLRIDFISKMILNEWKDIIGLHIKVFSEIRTDFANYYNKNFLSINKICDIFSIAANKQVRLDTRLVLDDPESHLNYNILFKKPEFDLCLSINDVYRYPFHLLSRLISIFRDLAPTGYISKRTLIYVLQDLNIYMDIASKINTRHFDKNSASVMPETWCNLEPFQIELLIDKMFGNLNDIDWKDFIVLNIDIPFPTHEELLKMRAEFKKYDPNSTELISVDEFFQIPLWFEQYEDFHVGKINSLREILLKLCIIQEHVINYTKLLFLFCKDYNAVEGFAKAIELSIGNYVCYDNELGKDFVNIIMTQRYEHEQLKAIRDKERQENIEIAQGILATNIDTTVHLCDSILIDDYYSETIEKVSSNKLFAPECLEESIDESESSILSDFTNVSIGYECRQYVNMTYILPYKTLRALVFAIVPRRFEFHKTCMDNINIIYEQCRRDDFNGEVLVHEFLHNIHFQQMLADFQKFKIISPELIVCELLNK